MRLIDPVAELLASQHSVATRRQLLAFMSVPEFDAMVRWRDLERVHWTVYRPRGAELTYRGELMAAALRAGPRSRIDGPAVLALLGLDVFGPRPPFVAAVVFSRRVRRVSFGVWPDQDSTAPRAQVGPIPITPPARALVHSAAARFGIDDRTLRSAYDRARWRKVVTTRAFEVALDDAPAAPGAERWARILGRTGTRPESEPERVLGSLLRQYEPAATPQVWALPGVRVDWFFRSVRLAIGYQGVVDHDSPEGRESDTARHLDLEMHGIRWIPITAADLGEPDDLLAYLDHVLQQRGRELDVPVPRRRTSGRQARTGDAEQR